MPPDSVRVRSSFLAVSEKASSSSAAALAAVALGHPK
jgi:hypothetical protein